MRRLRVTSDPGLPPLAWCVRLRRGNDVELLCGASVEVRDDGFFEGAWAGRAEAFDFTDATDVFGSGGRITGDHLTIVPPSHTLERVQFIQRPGETLISNSLVFLLTAAGAELDPHYAAYANDFTKIVYYGLAAFDTAIPLRFSGLPKNAAGGQNQAHLIYLKNIRLHWDGRISFVDKPAVPSFGTYDEYVALLVDVVQQTATNAASTDRKTRYSPLVTVSTGYDSSAVAAAVRRAGGEKAVTFLRARAEGRSEVEEDSGRPIADALGYQLKEFDREAYRNMGSLPEAEFLATGMSGEDVNLVAFEADLRHSVFFTGFHGGRVWNMHGSPDVMLTSNDMSGGSMNEFRLRADFVHVPAPFIGARRQPKILEIGNSEAMKRWSIGTDYDRPVARRIAEDAGVPRAAFGQKKRATTALLHVNGDSAWTPATREAVRQYARGQKLGLQTRLSYLFDATRESARSFAYRALHKLELLHLVPGLAEKPAEVHSHTLLGPLPILWATAEIASRYKPAVEAWSDER
ncbi:hypothetical protein A5724_07150 [Mycobacterium sp. ACS1612]|uniref:hypothetical protein n=1 Tax=Mycobacterium sp. ACS1612 TaxID=1834117 RepID=UPI0007FC7220|nr:hypothetical protein [Mycobacterium sp. ACS1612]OBF40823.1 hypothetical protein A5724_07150 [Mycobacterium sp. ACS1612]